MRLTAHCLFFIRFLNNRLSSSFIGTYSVWPSGFSLLSCARSPFLVDQEEPIGDGKSHGENTHSKQRGLHPWDGFCFLFYYLGEWDSPVLPFLSFLSHPILLKKKFYNIFYLNHYIKNIISTHHKFKKLPMRYFVLFCFKLMSSKSVYSLFLQHITIRISHLFFSLKPPLFFLFF